MAAVRLGPSLSVALLAWLAGCGGTEFSAADEAGTGGSEAGQGGSTTSSGGRNGASGGTTSGGTGGTTGGSTGGSGGANGGGSGGGSGPLAAPCESLATEYCDWEMLCHGKLVHESAEACVEDVLSSCLETYTLPDATQESGALDDCAASWSAAECYGVLPGCDTPGGRATGEPCAASTQCQSQRCSSTATSCGQCMPPLAPAGTACAYDGDCETHTTCIDGVCIQSGAEGDACDEDAPCDTVLPPDGRLSCVDGVCTLVGKLGEPCHPDELSVLGCGYGGSCSPSGICVPVERAAPGETCGQFEDRVIACENGDCRLDGDDTTEAHCIEWADPGEECGVDAPTYRCKYLLECTSGGRCARPAEMPLSCD